MLDWVIKLFKWLINIWFKIPDEVKEAIIELIIKIFKPIFADYYDKEKSKSAN